jgi:hypothetical protein
MAGKQPDYNLSAFNKRTEAKGNVGAAWIGEGGRISIRLNPLVNLIGDGEWTFTLWPNDGGPRTSQARPAPPARAVHVEVDPDDDIPF